MSGSNIVGKRLRGSRLPAAAAALLAAGVLCGLAPPAMADPTRDPYGWLPRDYSSHGAAIDWLFYVIFWITMVIFVAVEAVLVYFLIKYRSRPGRDKGVFTHGNTRLEMTWTLLPAVILLALALFTKRVWDIYRYGPEGKDVQRTQVLVIGQQFKWNSIYPGPDGKIGTYLNFPRPSDPAYKHLKADEVVTAIQTDVRANPMGQVLDPDDPNDPGKDDDYDRLGAGRAIVLPVDTPLEVQLASTDVLHDFFLPHFRVKLDAVPGLKGHIFFTAKKQSTRTVPIDEVPAERAVWLGPRRDAKGELLPQQNVTLSGLPKSYKIYNPDATESIASGRRPIWLSHLESLQTAAQNRILRREAQAAAAENRQPYTRDTIPAPVYQAELASLRADLKSLGITELTYVDEPFEVVCEELCGEGHYTMNNVFIVLSQVEYRDFINKPGTADPPKRLTSPQPAPAPTAAAQ